MRPLVVQKAGSFLGKHSERVVVKEAGEVVQEIPFFRLEEIVLARRGVSLSSDLIEEACRRGIRIVFTSEKGTPYAMLTSPHLTATVLTRRAQLEAFRDARGFAVARAIVLGKLANQANLLKYFGKYLARAPEEAEAERLAEVRAALRGVVEARRSARTIGGDTIDAARGRLMGCEGEGGRQYWRGVSALLRRTDFVGREHRGATDPVNALLNYGYGILQSRVWGALLHAGLEPFAGFLHVDRSGRPSLVLDLMEEFRQPVVDRSVIALLNQGAEIKLESGFLDYASRRIVAERVIERLEAPVEHRGKRFRVASIIQAHALARALRGERGYRAYRFRW